MKYLLTYRTMFPGQIVIFLILLSFAGCKKETSVTKHLISDWQFRKSGDTAWLPADVPGCVHTDLLKNGRIEDPFFGDNEKKLQWIEKENWEYRALFEVDKSLLQHENTELVFEGLDTYTDVYLNDSLILSADNMFREWSVDCRKLLKNGQNELLIKFTSPVYMDSLKAAGLPYQLPDTRAFTRKAPYQYGWDWGPRFVTSGIWRPVYIYAWNEARITDVCVVQNEIQSEKAVLTAKFEIESSAGQQCRLLVQDSETDSVFAVSSVNLATGSNIASLGFNIPNPRLWWSNGMGDQNLYSLDFIIQAGATRDTISQNIGLRTVELVQNKDSIGESFYFKVNGVPVFMKGANYIPQDNFPSRVTDERYEAVIKSAADANMNMLRVWGGGIYENDIFYDLCDQYGILVWQDFMFACNMYPGDSAFINNVREEAVQHVKRRRNHPCLALWCGNNEIDEGWHNWGWQKALNYSVADSTEVWNNYVNVFEKILPEAVHTYCPNISYIPSSPRIGWGHQEAMIEGDMHYWGVWWGEEPFEIYEKKVGRFMSEYGFQGFPDIRTLDSCLNPEDMNLNSKALLNHQKHPRGMELIQTYMEREYEVPENFGDYVYVSQLVQAYGIRKAIEAHRRAMPRCMGTLYWQLNDCWQVISWSSTDYYGRWKALHYFVREAYQDLLISFEQTKDIVWVFVVSNQRDDLAARLTVEVMDFEGKIKWKSDDNIKIPAGTSKIYSELSATDFSHASDLLVAVLYLADSVVAENIFYFGCPKELNLPRAEISKQILPDDDGYLIRLNSDKLVKNIFLSSDMDVFFSENFFDLKPGARKTVKCITAATKDEFENSLQIIHLQSIYP